MNKTKTIIVAIIVLIVVGTGVGYLVWKPPISAIDFNATESFIKRTAADPNSRKVLVVFVHGIIGSGSDTWIAKDLAKDQSLPALISRDPRLGKLIDVLVFQYDSPMLGNAGHISDAAQDLAGFLDSEHVWEDYSKIVFVGHSMGGLVIRQYLIGHNEYAGRVPLIFLYATPTNGAEIASVASRISGNPQLKGMFPLDANDYLGSMYDNWTDSVGLNSIPTYCVYEGQDTFHVRIVSRSSASALCTKANRISANHIDIVKPNRGDKDPRYYLLQLKLQAALAQSAAGINDRAASSTLHVEQSASPRPHPHSSSASTAHISSQLHADASQTNTDGNQVIAVQATSNPISTRSPTEIGIQPRTADRIPDAITPPSATNSSVATSKGPATLTSELVVQSLRRFISSDKFPHSRSNYWWYIWLDLPPQFRDQVEDVTYTFDPSYIRYPIEAAINPVRGTARFGASACDDSGRVVVELRGAPPVAADFSLCRVQQINDPNLVPR